MNTRLEKHINYAAAMGKLNSGPEYSEWLKVTNNLAEVTAQRDELLAAADKVINAWPITRRKYLPSAIAILRGAMNQSRYGVRTANTKAAIAKAEGRAQ